MAHLHRSVATLRISGEDLDPAEISALLGCAPTSSQRKGDVFTSKASGLSRTVKLGAWRLEAADRAPEDLDGQIAELLSKLTPSLEIWASIAERYKETRVSPLLYSFRGVILVNGTAAAVGICWSPLSSDIAR